MIANKVAQQIRTVAVVFYLRKTVLADFAFVIQCSPITPLCGSTAEVGPHFTVVTCSGPLIFFSFSLFVVSAVLAFVFPFLTLNSASYAYLTH